jgi:hypothetical protein
MPPIVHVIGSWRGVSATTDNPRDRKWVTLAGEFSAPVAGLRDAWWNSIARAMS